MTVYYEDANLRIAKVDHMGPYDNNGFVLSCRKTGDGVIIDAPLESNRLLDEARGLNIKAVIITHQHRDHTAELDNIIKNISPLEVVCHVDDASGLPIVPTVTLLDDDIYGVGNLELRAIHTPGHTPGALCLLVERHLFAGDTLFSGGPGRTGSPDAFRQIKDSIDRKLMGLHKDTVVYTGHGDQTTIGEAQNEISVFDSKTHSEDLCGNVVWLTS